MFSVGLNSFHNNIAVEYAEKSYKLEVQQFKVISSFHFLWLLSSSNTASAGEMTTEGELKIINKFPCHCLNKCHKFTLEHVIEKSCFIYSISQHFSGWLIAFSLR